jgi:RNA polymerase primary sigma factor
MSIKTSLSQYISTIHDKETLSKSEFNEIHREYTSGSMAAKEKLIRHNLRLVICIASKYHQDNEKMLELIQEGNIGLIRAIEKFEPEKGMAFSTYATFWIKAKIQDFINNNTKLVRVPIHMMKLSRKIHRIKKEYPTLTIADIAKTLKLTERKVIAAIEAINTDTSLDAYYGSDDSDGGPISNNFADEIDILEQCEDDSSANWLNLQVAKLPEKQRLALIFSFGLNNEDQLSGEDIGKRLNLSRERARQLINEGTAAIARAAARDGINAQSFF